MHIFIFPLEQRIHRENILIFFVLRMEKTKFQIFLFKKLLKNRENLFR